MPKIQHISTRENLQDIPTSSSRSEERRWWLVVGYIFLYYVLQLFSVCFVIFFLNLFHVLVYIDQFKAIKSLNFFFVFKYYIYIIIIN